MARFEEALGALRAGKKVRRKGFGSPITQETGVGFAAYGYDLLADDWEVVEEKREPKSAGEALCVAMHSLPWERQSSTQKAILEDHAQAVIAWAIKNGSLSPPAPNTVTPKPKRPMRGRKVKPARVWLSPISGADGLYLAHDFQEQPYGDVVGVYELLVPIEKAKKRVKR